MLLILMGEIGRINGINIEGTYTTYTMDDRLSDYAVCGRDTIYRRSDIDDNCCFLAISIIEHRICRETIRDIAIGNDKTDSTASNDDGFEKYFKYKKGKRL